MGTCATPKSQTAALITIASFRYNHAIPADLRSHLRLRDFTCSPETTEIPQAFRTRPYDSRPSNQPTPVRANATYIPTPASVRSAAQISRRFAIGSHETESGGWNGPSCAAIGPITIIVAANWARTEATPICAIRAIKRTHAHLSLSEVSRLNASRSIRASLIFKAVSSNIRSRAKPAKL
jgi:hypothetical protein